MIDLMINHKYLAIFRSIAFPLIGVATGEFSAAKTIDMMQEQMYASPYSAEVIIVQFQR